MSHKCLCRLAGGGRPGARGIQDENFRAGGQRPLTITYEATVENGQIKLPGAVHLPEHTKVFVVVPGVEVVPASRINSPRLAHPEQASDFVKEVLKES